MAQQIEQIEQDRAVTLGNTELPGSPRQIKEAEGADAPKKQAPQYTYWCFTLNNYDAEHIEQIEQILRHECKWYIFQEEIGENTGTPHLQGIISLKDRQRLTELKKWDSAIHWEPTKSVKASIAYCSKEKTRAPNGRVFTHGIEIPEPLDVDEPRGWQHKVMDIIKAKPDKRTIHWFWEPEGNVGKTSLCKYLVAKHNALMLCGKAADMYHMLSKFPQKRKLVLIDVPRSSQDYINYGAIEQIKNGLIFSGKYEGCQLVFNCPHVIVFANEKPDFEKMSADRWKIHRIQVCSLENYYRSEAS